MIGNEIKNIKKNLSIKKAAIFGRLAIISNSLNFPRGEFSHSSFSGLPSSSLFCLLGGFGGGGSLSFSLVIPSHISFAVLLSLVGA